MKALLTALLLVISSFTLSPAFADDSLYRDLGGREGITKIVDVEMVRHLANPRIKAQFDDTNIDRLKEQIVIFICDASGGPCKYTGPDLHTVHKGMHLTEADFNSFVEDMQSAMDELGVSFSTQNRLLARLAPFERDVVTK
jgi:hemoglobin